MTTNLIVRELMGPRRHRVKNALYKQYRHSLKAMAKDAFCIIYYNPVMEVIYDEDEEDGTPCLLMIFKHEFALSADMELSHLKTQIRRHRHLGYFRIDATARARKDLRGVFVERDILYQGTPPETSGQSEEESN